MSLLFRYPTRSLPTTALLPTLAATVALACWSPALGQDKPDAATASVEAAAAEVATGDPAKEAELLTKTHQVTFEGLRAGEGYFSADGRLLVFQSEREPGNPFYQIYLMDLETGDTQRISPGYGKTTCAWIHPDGKRG